MTGRDWRAWHDAYDQPESSLAQRLAVVRQRIGLALDEAPAGPLRAISMCAGQGRDLIPVLAAHPRGRDVAARLVELDPVNAQAAREAASAAGLTGVDVVTGDASIAGAYAGLVPADLVLACGVFGNITDADIRFTIECCRQLCTPGGVVIWTRGRRIPDKLPAVSAWFGERGFDLIWTSGPEVPYGVGVHRFAGAPQPFQPSRRMFTFVGSQALAGT